MKKCPFRKRILRTDYNTYGMRGIPAFDYKEEFEDCIGSDCMAYGEDYKHMYTDEDRIHHPSPICLLARERK